MNQERVFKVLLSPVVSEKSVGLTEQSQQYCFKVRPDVTKLEIRKAVEQLFDVNVLAVRVANMKGKRKRSGRSIGKRSDWKKAYIRVREGQEINLMDAE